MPELTLLTPQDYDAALELWRRCALKITAGDDRPGYERLLARNPTTCLGLCEGDRLIGTVLGTFDGRRGYVHHLAVDPACRGRELGRLLMRELVKLFREMGIGKAHLFIEKRNPHLVDYYQSLDWYLREDLHMMSLDLFGR